MRDELFHFAQHFGKHTSRLAENRIKRVSKATRHPLVLASAAMARAGHAAWYCWH